MKSSWFNKKRILLITVSVVIIVALCVGIFALKDNMSSNSPKDCSNITVSSAEDAATQLKELGDDIGYENALSELTEKSTTTIDGDTYYRLQQNYQGIPVYGRTVVYVTDEKGKTIAITGNALDVGEKIDTVPTASIEQLTAKIAAYTLDELGFAVDACVTSILSKELVWYVDSSENTALAYCVMAYIGENPYEVVVDANTGEVFAMTCQIATESVSVNMSVNDYEHEINLWQEEDGRYITYDAENDIRVLSANGETLIKYVIVEDSTGAKYIYDPVAELWFDEHLVVSAAPTSFNFVDFGFKTKEAISGVTQPTFSSLETMDQDACKMLFFVTVANDYFTEALSREGWGNGTTETLEVVFDCANGSYHYSPVRGVSMLSIESGESLNTVAHELTHAMERSASRMTYSGESGAIMEALSDIFAEFVENNLLGECDWLFDSGLRNLIDPSLSTESGMPHPITYQGQHWYEGKDSSTFVHINSTVISHTAYLMSKDGGGLLTVDELAKLWYRAMLMMPSDCDFAECRTLVELAARSMGLSDTQIACVEEAFDTVGISNGETVDYEVSSSATLSVYGADSNLCSNYSMQIAGTKTVWNKGVDPTEDFYNMYIYFKQNTFTEKHYETRKIATNEPVLLGLDLGTYTITLIDDKGTGTPVSFKIKVGGQNGKDNLDIYTNFVVDDSQLDATPGTNTTEPDTNGTEGNTNMITYYIGSTRGFSDGVAWVEARQKENGVIVETQWACIDTSGNVLFMLDPNTFEPSSFANGVSLYKTYDSDYEVNAYNIIDKSGNIVFSSTDGSFDAVIAHSRGYFAVYTYTESFREAGYTVFFMNPKGEVTNQIDGLRTEIPELINCGEGVFAEKIRQNADAAVTYRFYDAKTGNEYEVGGISSHKSMSYIFHNGYAVIEGKRMGDIPKLVSTDGQIIELKQFGYGSFYNFGPVSDGGFVCTSYYQDKVEWVKFYDISTGTLTQLGNYGERVALNRATGFRFDNGSMLLPLNGADGKTYYTIVDKSGQSLFEPVVCKYADSEGSDRILVKYDDKTVAYNGRGEVIFELPAGQSVDSYQDGVARLVGSDYAISNTYIDLYGKPIFDSDILLFKSKK